jgi:hypothetical protein
MEITKIILTKVSSPGGGRGHGKQDSHTKLQPNYDIELETLEVEEGGGGRAKTQILHMLSKDVFDKATFFTVNICTNQRALMN